MKRSPLKRTTPLARKQPLRASTRPVEPSYRSLGTTPQTGGRRPQRPAKRRPLEPGEEAWKRKRWGRCAGCGAYGRIVLHHCVSEQELRRSASDLIEFGVVWNQQNAIKLGAPYAMGGNPRCSCHDGHHHPGVNDTRLPMSVVPSSAIAFANLILGPDRAEDYFKRHYRQEGE